MTEKLLTDVEYNYKFIDERIAEAAEKSGRKREDITFLAATKMVEPEVINHAISLGLDHIGENKVQELLSKYDKYNLDNCSLQFIGHLQTNKINHQDVFFLVGVPCRYAVPFHRLRKESC